MSEWRPLQDEFQDELLRHDGLADDTEHPCCSLCSKVYDPTPTDVPGVVATIYKCRTCGAFLQCRECCLEEHIRRPLHVIEVRSPAFRFSLELMFSFRNGTEAAGSRPHFDSLGWSINWAMEGCCVSTLTRKST
jgi:hypothetical protein